MLLRKISHNLAVTQPNALFIGVLHILHRVFHTVMSTFEMQKKYRAAHAPAGRPVFRSDAFAKRLFRRPGARKFFIVANAIYAHIWIC